MGSVFLIGGAKEDFLEEHLALVLRLRRRWRGSTKCSGELLPVPGHLGNKELIVKPTLWAVCLGVGFLVVRHF